ncbi:UPF0462 protein C4orf33 homolog [Lingula anatina]|uniref:UPF0462 protein C4orf33 homolog n=1 Tax=Lingula anatina TaxID=7574 RepID=A0A1S3K450_LINAN|nr:UPF0462 protein C4orf33 homolog [Lingula anatina]|eukprot:XP_013417302.1 UPF0462 protein C4orf33 homolog [Lingula anatina]
MLLTYHINCHWNGQPLDHLSTELSLQKHGGDLKLEIMSPFFNTPSPAGQPGQPFPQLWDEGEVVEAFFLNDDNQYLEVEFSPYGHHLVLMLNGVRKCFKDKLPLQFSANIEDKKWTGSALIPLPYFPPKVTKFNAYAIHNCNKERHFEALYPVDAGKHTEPDFHRLEYFQPIDFKTLLPENWSPDHKSAWWTQDH